MILTSLGTRLLSLSTQPDSLCHYQLKLLKANYQYNAETILTRSQNETEKREQPTRSVHNKMSQPAENKQPVSVQRESKGDKKHTQHTPAVLVAFRLP